MLYVLTVHFRDPRWIAPQQRFLDRFAPRATERWAILDGIDAEHAGAFDRLVEFEENHPLRLNEMARQVSAEANPEDVLLFLDGDAFPLRDLQRVIDSLATTPLVAVRRDENLGDPQPHPCFCVTTVGFWNEIGGDWGLGYKWRNADDEEVTDSGANLLRALREHRAHWRPLTRRNTVDLHPVWFGVYGDDDLGPVVYHHGAGFRERRGRADRAPGDRPFGIVERIAREIPVVNRGTVKLRAFRQARWERTIGAEQERTADEIFDALMVDDDFFRRFLS